MSQHSQDSSGRHALGPTDGPGGSPVRELDLVLLGATGFTGGLTARELAQHAPAGLRWAVAGRDPARLDQLVESLADTQCPPSAWIVVDASKPALLDGLVRRTAAVVSTVGPYLEHGEPLVRACATHGTHYLDLTGEPEFVDRMYDLHHARAVGSGAKLVHACGFDSVPHDLGAQFTVEQFTVEQLGSQQTDGQAQDPGVPITMRGVVRTSGSFSGGTLHSALGAISRRKEAKRAADRRRRREKRPTDRRARVVSLPPRRDEALGVWLLPLPTIDPAVVVRSARALPEYGPDFSYSHHVGVARTSRAVMTAGGALGLVAAAQVPPLREAIGKRVPRGSGPSPERRERSRFSVDFIAEAGGRTVHTRVSGGDPGYTETSKMLAQAALCLLLDDVPDVAGQVTTAVAMGPALRRRLVERGIGFEVLDL